MNELIEWISSHEEWLMQRILDYAKAREYTRYTSTLVEAWRLSISGLSESLINGLKEYNDIPELNPDEDYSKDNIASFGILEAQRHRSRGITLSMFLGLMKYYRKSYIDLILESEFEDNDKNKYIGYIDRFFDRLEIGFSSEWSEITEKGIIEDLQLKNRIMTNEKNKYLTIFDSLNVPMFFLNDKNTIENLNHATSEYFDFYKTSGEKYYEIIKKEVELYFLKDEIKDFIHSKEEKTEFEKSIITKKGLCFFQVKMKRMLDVSGKFFGTVVILNDLTELKNTSELLKESEEKFRNFTEQSVEGIVIIDINGRIVEWNKSQEKITGMKKEQTLGKYLWDIQYQMMPNEIKSEKLYIENKNRINLFLKTKDAPWINKIIENRIVTPSGKIKTVQTIIFPVETKEKFLFGSVMLDVTERKEYEESLKQSEDRYKNIVKDQTEFITRFTPDGIHTFVNDAYCNYMHMKREDLIGKSFFSFLPKDDYLELKSVLDSLNQRTPIKEIEHRYIIEEIPKWLHWINRAIFDDKGNLIEYQAVGRDITDKKLIEEELKESERAMSTLIENLPGLVYRCKNDADWTMIFLSGNCYQLTGYSEKELINNSLISYGEIVHPEDQKLIWEKVQDAIMKKSSFELIYRIITKDGKEKWVLERGTGVYSSNGTLKSLEGFIQEITDLKKAEEAIRLSEEKYRELVENANSIILKFDNEGRILSMNEYGLKFFGYSEDEIIGKFGYGTIIPEIESSGKELNKLIKNMINLESEYNININENVKKNGKRVWVYWTNKPIKNDRGIVNGILCVGTDITDRKKAEDKVNELNETLRILNKILRHDILNDLTIVLTAVDLMSEENEILKQKASKAISKSIDLIERMRELEQALISRREIEKYEINEVIQEVIRNYPETDFKIIGKCKICSDEAIFSVFDNLIRNAIVHGKTKKIDIEIREKENSCEIRIIDFGVGIPKKIKNRIFEEGFSYGENKSTGLGLYIVKKIMERYDGSIKVMDNKPTGTIFVLEYPFYSSNNKIC